MLRTWAFVSQKGGSGKSTLCTQLSVYAGQCGEKVIVLDLDPQGSSSMVWHRLRGEGMAPQVIPVAPDRLEATLDAIRNSGAFTLVLIDTAPHSDKTAVDAIRLSDIVLIPTTPGAFSLGALKDTVEIIDGMSAAEKARVVVNKVRGKIASAQSAEIAEIASRAGVKTLSDDKDELVFVRDLVPIEAAINMGKGVTEKGAYHKESASDIQKLWGAATKLSTSLAARETKANV